jgi:hypothetical protein
MNGGGLHEKIDLWLFTVYDDFELKIIIETFVGD